MDVMLFIDFGWVSRYHGQLIEGNATQDVVLGGELRSVDMVNHKEDIHFLRQIKNQILPNYFPLKK